MLRISFINMRRRHHTFHISVFSFQLKQNIQSYTTLDVLLWDVPQMCHYHKTFLIIMSQIRLISPTTQFLVRVVQMWR